MSMLDNNRLSRQTFVRETTNAYCKINWQGIIKYEEYYIELPKKVLHLIECDRLSWPKNAHHVSHCCLCITDLFYLILFFSHCFWQDCPERKKLVKSGAKFWENSAKTSLKPLKTNQNRGRTYFGPAAIWKWFLPSVRFSPALTSGSDHQRNVSTESFFLAIASFRNSYMKETLPRDSGPPQSDFTYWRRTS